MLTDRENRTPPFGYWTTDAPVTPEMIQQDTRLLEGITIPEGAHLDSAEVYVNGRLWRWERLAVPFRQVKREVDVDRENA